MNLKEPFECCACWFTFKNGMYLKIHIVNQQEPWRAIWMLCMLIYFQKRNKFEDIHCQRAWTLNSHLTVVHVEPGHLVEPAQAGQSPRWSTCHCTRWGWAHSVSGWPWGTVVVVEQQISPRSKCTTTLWETFSKISKLIWGQLIKVNSTRAFQKIDFNWLIGIILVWDKLNLF